MIGLSFLGKGNYQSTLYTFNNQSIETPYFPYAFNQLFSIDNHFVVMTEQADEKHGEELRKILDFTSIMVPVGKTEDEVWDLFDAIVEHLPENEHLMLDVTHGFRTQPLLALATAIFLRNYKNITIQGIYYGAFDAKNEQNISPVFNLTPFLDLIDWTFAFRRYREKGDAHELQHILTKLHSKTHKEKLPYKAQGLSLMGDKLAKLMDGLSVIRPQEVIEQSASIQKIYEKTVNDLNAMRATKPMTLFMDQLQEKVDQLAEANDKGLMSEEGIEGQFIMLDHYIQTSQYQQALTLAAELQLSWACYKHNKPYTNRDNRNTIKNRLMGIAKKEIDDNIELWESKLAQLFYETSEPRNDLNHAGMREDPKPSKSLIKMAEKYVAETKELIASYEQ